MDLGRSDPTASTLLELANIQETLSLHATDKIRFTDEKLEAAREALDEAWEAYRAAVLSHLATTH